ncbi:MAG: hypothetical protein E7348_01995 [Clostridiales bacterium]|nr:hypothetical protein [Clostridiales bacterium]
MVEKLKQNIIEKAANNIGKQAYIRPSEFLFGRKKEDTEKCLNIILGFDFVKTARILGKDLIDVILK